MSKVALACLAGALMVVVAATGCTGVARESDQAAARGLERLPVAPLDPTGSGGNFRSLKSVADTSSAPGRLPVYKVVPARITRQWVGQRAEKLGLIGPVQDDGARFSVRGAAGTLEVDAGTGSFDYTTDAFAAQTESIRTLLSDEEYRRRAEDFLARTGLMHPKARFRDVNRANVTAVYDGGEWLERPYLVEVRFSHIPLDGVPFDQGVGPKIIVQFGEDGQVLGALSVWREIERAGDYTLITPEQAIASLRRGEGQLFEVDVDADGTADEIGLSYLNDPLGYDQQYVIPSYVIRGKSSSSNGRFVGLVRALPPSALRVDPSIARGVAAPVSRGPK